MDKSILQTQIAFFLKKEFAAFESFSLEVKKILGETTTQYLPVPLDAPTQFPRLIIIYTTYRIVVFKNRIDILFEGGYDKVVLKKITEVLSGILGLSVARIGFVKTFFVNSDIAYLKSLVPKIMSNSNVKELNIGVNIKGTTNGYECNNLEKIDPGSVIDAGTTKTGLIVLKDCNTIQSLSLPELNAVQLLELITEMDKTFSIFFLI